jgi:repressor LexA
MSGAGILDGDLVIARQQEDASDGDFVIVQVDSEDAAIKKLQGSGSEARLVAMPAGRPITAVKGERVHICGRVIELRRELY